MHWFNHILLCTPHIPDLQTSEGMASARFRKALPAFMVQAPISAKSGVSARDLCCIPAADLGLELGFCVTEVYDVQETVLLIAGLCLEWIPRMTLRSCPHPSAWHTLTALWQFSSLKHGSGVVNCTSLFCCLMVSVEPLLLLAYISSFACFNVIMARLNAGTQRESWGK